jgi:hypothetical protein
LYLKVQQVLAHRETPDTSPPVMGGKQRPGPKYLKYRVPTDHWPMIIHRVAENNEPLRAIAQEYGVSHETIRRLILHAHKPRGQQEA